MKAKLSDLPDGSCFTQGGRLKKKLPDGRVAMVAAGGKVRTRTPKGNPTVSVAACPLHMLGVGLRKTPDMMIEIGNGRPRKIVDKTLRRL